MASLKRILQYLVIYPILIGIFLSINQRGFAQQSEVQIGQIVEVNTSGQNLNLRTSPGLDQPIVAKMPNGTHMTVIAGPKSADGHIWWELEGELGKGWAAQDYLKTAELRSLPFPQADTTGCEEPIYPGVQYCQRDGGATHLAIINLNDPHLRFETVMAKDTESVNTNNRESVRDMAARHLGEGAVLAINADYFGSGHGPEGLTIVNGKRLDGEDRNDDDNNSVYRSALIFSRPLIDGGGSPIAVQTRRFPNDTIDVNPQSMYNAVGGGPQIVFDGSWDWTRGKLHPRYDDCPTDIISNDVINGECFRGTSDWDASDKVWSAVGVTEDNHLVFVVTPFPHVKTIFEEWSVKQGFKLDGGGSSQIWYNNRSLVDGSRKVANGLLVFYKYVYQVQEQSKWPVVVAGESTNIRFVLRNLGADTWNPGQYKIISEKNGWNQSRQFDLPHVVGPGGTLTWEAQTGFTDQWGIVTYEFQLVDQAVQFPTDPIRIQVIVLPEELAEKKAELEMLIQEKLDEGLENLEAFIADWISRQLNNLFQEILDGICPPQIIILPIGTLLIYRQIKRRKTVSNSKG